MSSFICVHHMPRALSTCVLSCLQETMADVKRRSCARFELDPRAMDLWKHSVTSAAKGSEALSDSLHVPDADFDDRTTLLLEPKV
jgi:hypothetical protein